MKFQKVKRIYFSIPQTPNEKNWVIVEFENGTLWMPAICDVGEIIVKIGQCEDVKYPNGEGYKYLQRFFNECYNKTPMQIKKLYKDKFDPNKLLKRKDGIS